jgi:hypothetical protein
MVIVGASAAIMTILVAVTTHQPLYECKNVADRNVKLVAYNSSAADFI